MQEKLSAAAVTAAAVIMRHSATEWLNAKGRYTVECFDRNGHLKWSDTIDNVVTTAGKNAILDKFFAGAAYTASLFMGLKAAGTAVAADTQASHGAWTEVGGANAPVYSGTRPVPAFAAASGGAKALSSVVAFSFTSAGTVAGCFLNQGGAAAQDNTTGTLVSAGDFSSGSRSVLIGDLLNVSWSISI